MATRTWSSGYEADPDDSDLVSEGAERIRDARKDSRERGDAEHQWTDGVVGNANDSAARNNSGRHREGSARAFVAAGVPPTVLPTPDSNADTALDDGRMHFRTDDDYLLQVYDGTAGAWRDTKVARVPELDPALYTANQLIQFDGTNFIPVSPAVSYAEVTTAQDISMNFGAPSEGAAWTTVTSLTSTITVPSTGQYYIRVHMTVAGRALPGGGQDFVWFDTVLFENKDAAGAVEKGRQRNAGRDIVYGPGAQNSLGYVVVPATPGSTYVYTVGARAATGLGGATWRISGSHGSAPNEGDMASTLIAELIPYTT